MPITDVYKKQLAQAHLEAGHTTDVVSADPPGSVSTEDFPGQLYALGPPLTHYCYSPRVLPWLRVHAADYDAVIVNGLWQYTGFAVWRALHASDTPYFVFPHGMLDPWFKRTYPLKHYKKWLFWPWSDYRLLRDAQGAFFTCEEERLLARETFPLYRCSELVVHLGIADPGNHDDAQRAAFLRRYPDLSGKRLLLFMGRLQEKKGCDMLVHAFSAIAAARPELHLVMAGPDQSGWQQDLVALSARLGIADRITWTGMLKDDLKWGAYRAAEALVLPSHQENFGIVVAEALACGIPALISNKVNIWREIEADQAGLVENDTAAGTTALLRRWLSLEPEAAARLTANARRCFERRFEISRAASNVASAIEHHLQTNKGERSLWRMSA